MLLESVNYLVVPADPMLPVSRHQPLDLKDRQLQIVLERYCRPATQRMVPCSLPRSGDGPCHRASVRYNNQAHCRQCQESLDKG